MMKNRIRLCQCKTTMYFSAKKQFHTDSFSLKSIKSETSSSLASDLFRRNDRESMNYQDHLQINTKKWECHSNTTYW